MLAVISAALQFSTPNIADPDSFYHLAHAKIYAERGIFYNEFPWAQFSVIKNLKADIWYGFHLFLIPFTFIKDGILGIKLAGAVITFLTLTAFYWSFNRLKIKWPWVWTLVFIVAAPDVMYRLTMTRPHNLSLALTLIIFALALTSRKKWPILPLGFIAAFLHSALGWLPVLAVTTVFLIQKLRREPAGWLSIFYAATGGVVGLLARPHPWGAVKLTYIQVVEIMLVKTKNIPLLFGRELNPPDLDLFLKNILPATTVLLISLIYYKTVSRKIYDAESQQQKTFLWAALPISLFFFLITTLVARRSYDIFISFGLMSAALALTFYLKPKPANPRRESFVMSALIIAVGLAGLNSIPLFKEYNRNAWPPDDLKESSLWLKANARPGEIVFNTSWDQLGSLMFWNRQNYYINGMDPIFQYTYSQSLYWKNHFMLADTGYTHTCGLIKCLKEEIEPVGLVLARDFGASYVVLKKDRNPKTYFYWARDKTLPLVFDGAKDAVFRVPLFENE